MMLSNSVVAWLFGVALFSCSAINAQPFSVESAEFEPDLSEPVMRTESNYTGFVFDFDKEPVRPCEGPSRPQQSHRQTVDSC